MLKLCIGIENFTGEIVRQRRVVNRFPRQSCALRKIIHVIHIQAV